MFAKSCRATRTSIKPISATIPRKGCAPGIVTNPMNISTAPMPPKFLLDSRVIFFRIKAFFIPLFIGSCQMTSRAIMFHGYDYISCFLTLFHILVSLDNPFQRVASINDRPKLSRLDKLFEKENVFLSVFWNRKYNFFASKY